MNGGDASETKDPSIKLFGKTIPVSESSIPATGDVGFLIPFKSEAMNVCNERTKTEAKDDHLEESGNQCKSSIADDCKENDDQVTGERHVDRANVKPKEEPAETSSVETKQVLKKPDKVLACPRCNSFDTKFCYFNNYNVNQPRHFCKQCHRYWTAGGTVRNVPVGAGRRKNKHLTSPYRQLLVSPEISGSANQQIFSRGESWNALTPGNGTVLKFAPDGRFCVPMETVHVKEEKGSSVDLSSMRERRDETSLLGSSTTASKTENHIPQEGNEQSIQLNPLQCYPVPPWVFAWNHVWNGGGSMAAAQCSSESVSAPDSCDRNLIQRCSTPMLGVGVPGFCTQSIPLQFVPASYWSCLPLSAMQIPMVGSDGGGKGFSDKKSPTLGKRSTDANSSYEDKSENCVLVPKTRRTDASMSSTKKEIELRCGVFRPYKSSPECKGRHPSDTTEVLGANPCSSLSLAHTFQEST